MFTEKQIDNWNLYENIRRSGIINMYEYRAGCDITGMTKEEWLFCMSNYNALYERVKGVKP